MFTPMMNTVTLDSRLDFNLHPSKNKSIFQSKLAFNFVIVEAQTLPLFSKSSVAITRGKTSRMKAPFSSSALLETYIKMLSSLSTFTIFKFNVFFTRRIVYASSKLATAAVSGNAGFAKAAASKATNISFSLKVWTTVNPSLLGNM